MTDSQDIRPVPDPTVLTQEASTKLEAMIRNLIKTEIEHQRELFDEKLDGISNQFSERLATISEKIAGIGLRLDLLDARTAEQKSDTKAALDAALAAQKEAVAAQTESSDKSINKSETATTERIKAVETLLNASTRASDDKIDDLKSRIVAIEAVKIGNVEHSASARGNMVSIMSVVVAIIAVVSAIAAVVIALKP
jgi:uncharacterized protein (DUF342 family)